MSQDEDDPGLEAGRLREELEALGQQRLFPPGTIRQRLGRFRHAPGCGCEDCQSLTTGTTTQRRAEL